MIVINHKQKHSDNNYVTCQSNWLERLKNNNKKLTISLRWSDRSLSKCNNIGFLFTHTKFSYGLQCTLTSNVFDVSTVTLFFLTNIFAMENFNAMICRTNACAQINLRFVITYAEVLH